MGAGISKEYASLPVAYARSRRRTNRDGSNNADSDGNSRQRQNSLHQEEEEPSQPHNNQALQNPNDDDINPSPPGSPGPHQTSPATGSLNEDADMMLQNRRPSWAERLNAGGAPASNHESRLSTTPTWRRTTPNSAVHPEPPVPLIQTSTNRNRPNNSPTSQYMMWSCTEDNFPDILERASHFAEDPAGLEDYLEVLKLDRAKISDSQLKKQKRLKRIKMEQLRSFQTVGFCSERLVYISPNIGILHMATSLQICCNNLTYIPPEIGYLRNLTVLSVAKNKITSLPETIGYLTKLTDFRASHNLLTAVPDSLGNCVNLKTLSLNNNNIAKLP
ncbi:hypothetical protein HDV05_008125, partial [Chytridiales sp. JEL 0842]